MKPKIHLFLLLIFLFAISSFALTIDCQTQNDLKPDFIKRLQGTWIHEDDKNASILIKGKSFTFNYSGEKRTADYTYLITITDQLPEFVDKDVKTEFLILTQKTDTLQYEILGLTEKTLSLMHFPSCKRHLYTKRK